MNFSSQKSEDEQFSTLLNEIDELLEQYDPGELHPDHILGELIQYRAAQRPLFEQAIHLCTEGLNRFPRNGELLSRRGYAYARVVTDEMEYLLITEADQDLWEVLTFEPRNISAALDLLNELFTFSGLEDEEVTKLSRQIAEKSESLMLQARSLQIRSLLSAERHSEAPKIAEDILAHYPNSEEIYEALKLSVFDEEYRK